MRLPVPSNNLGSFVQNSVNKAAKRGECSILLEISTSCSPFSSSWCEETEMVLIVISSERRDVFGLRQNIVSISTALQGVHIWNITNRF